jgi:hypothetical protein
MTEPDQELVQEPESEAAADEDDVEAHGKGGLGGGATRPIQPPDDE